MATQMVKVGQRTTSWWYCLLAASIAAPLLLGACCWGLWYRAANTITIWEIPADYRGWVVLEWENPECPKLPSRGLSRIIPVDATGYACTSNRPEDVPSGYRTFFVYPDGHREELRAQDYNYKGVQPYFGFTRGGVDGSQRYDASYIGTGSGFDAEPHPVKCATPVRTIRACLP
jgi:hypothetical protein